MTGERSVALRRFCAAPHVDRVFVWTMLAGGAGRATVAFRDTVR